MHYYKHHIGDFLRDAGTLPNEHLGAYMRLLWSYYLNESPITGDIEDIAFDVSSRPEVVRQLLRKFFHETPEGWRHNRCDQEISAYHGKAQKARESANARWGDANGMRTHSERNANASKSDANHKPLTINHKSKSKEIVSPDGDPPSRFDDFWREYPRDEGKKKAREVWARKKLDALADRIIADVKARKAGHGQWLDGYVPHATTYLNGERWNDAIRPRDGPKPAQQAPTSKTAQALMALEAMKSGNGMAAGSGFGGAATSRLLGFGPGPGGGGAAADSRGVGRVFDA